MNVHIALFQVVVLWKFDITLLAWVREWSQSDEIVLGVANKFSLVWMKDEASLKKCKNILLHKL